MQALAQQLHLRENERNLHESRSIGRALAQQLHLRENERNLHLRACVEFTTSVAYHAFDKASSFF
jgi:hypothetical protein